MKVEVNEHGTIEIKEVFNPIKLVTDDGGDFNSYNER
jgi:hypothetical protein